MAFCSFSSEEIVASKTLLDNLFISDFLPFASGNDVRVYLYGLYLCSHGRAADNTLEKIAKVLKMPEDEVLASFTRWQEEGLVQMMHLQPTEVRYLPINNIITSIKKYNPKKYETFNIQMQEIIKGRPVEYQELSKYYDLIEINHVEKDALLMIAKYCVNLKGDQIGYPYIVAIAKNWAHKGIKTAQAVEEELKAQEANSDQLQLVLKALYMKRLPTPGEAQSFRKWQKEYNLSFEAIMVAAKSIKRGGFARLESRIENYITLGIASEKEIVSYEKQHSEMTELSASIVRNLGLYYENLDPVVDQYITPWLAKGFSASFLKEYSVLCLRQNVRTLESFSRKLDALYALGVLNSAGFDQYLKQLSARDGKIKEILQALGLVRNVSAFDRKNYATWADVWNFAQDVILFAAGIAKTALNPLSYLNAILADYKTKGIKTLEDAQKAAPQKTTKNITQSSHNYLQHDYTNEELNSLFDNLDEVLYEVKGRNS